MDYILLHYVCNLCDWFNLNRLKVNIDKTNLILFGSFDQQCRSLSINISGFDVHPAHCVQYLGVVLDQKLSLDNQVTNIMKLSFAFLRSLYRVRNYLSRRCLLSAVNTYVLSRVDYCSSLLSFCNKKTTYRLQRVQNCLARIVQCLSLIHI